MGYDITIGEACISPGRSADEPAARIEVEAVKCEGSPNFRGGGTSSISPSYTGWAHFCRDAGIYELFYGDPVGRNGLMHSHPGAATLFPEHLAEIRAALDRHLAKPWPASKRICGFELTTLERGWREINDRPDPRYDCTWARLVWLKWWVSWALANCKNPCIFNR